MASIQQAEVTLKDAQATVIEAQANLTKQRTGAAAMIVQAQAAVCFAVAVGLFFSIAPARSAAWLDPIEALRYE